MAELPALHAALDATARLAALAAYAVMDTRAEAEFDDLARLAAHACGAPVAFVTFVDARRQFFKAGFGADGGEAARHALLESGFCPLVVASGSPLVIPDARADPAHAGNPAVAGPAAVRFYAGVPLVSPGGQAVGTLSVLDRQARRPSAGQLWALSALGRQVITLLELRCQLAERQGLETARARSDRRSRAAFDQTLMGMVETDFAGRVLQANAAFCRLVGRPLEELVGRTSAGYTPPEDASRDAVSIASVGHGEGDRFAYDKRYVRPDGSVVWARLTASALRDDGGRVTSLIAAAEDVTARRRAEAELVQSRERFALAVEGAGLGTFHWDLPVTADTRYDWNATLKGFFWLPPDAVAGPQVRQRAVHPDDRERVGAAVERAIRDGVRYDEEYRILGPAGQVRWVRAIGQASGGGGGRPTRFGGIVMDVTDRRRADEAARDALAQRRLAMDLARLGWWRFDVGTGRFSWDERFGEIFGLGGVATLDHAGFMALVHPDDRDGLLAEVGAALDPAARAPFADEYRIRPAGGGLRWVRVNGRVEFSGDGAGAAAVTFAGSAVDVTAARAAADALRDSEARFRHLADAMPQIVWTARPDGVLDYYNRRWHEYTRRPDPGDPRQVADPAVADPSVDADRWGEFVHPDDLPRAGAAWAAALRSGDPYTVEFRLRSGSDVYRWFLVRALAIRDERGGITRWFGTCTDVDDQKRLEAENLQLLERERSARAEAERQGRMKDEFLATLSHELRTPLNAVLGWAQILSGDLAGGGAPDRQDLVDGLATIDRNARSQRQIIEDLLDMSRVIAGTLRMDVQRLDVAPVIRASIDTVAAAAAAKGVRIQPVLDPSVGPVSGDPHRLQQVFWNLLSNAVKFTPKGGRVQVQLGRVDSHVEASISDTGEGIPPEFLPFVFDRFRQADASSTRRHGGLGLGLAIVKQLVELHGGTVRVRSPGVGQGSTFVVELPLTVVHPAPATPGPDPSQPRTPAAVDPAPEARHRLDGVRVLVVDDEPDARAVVRRLLADCGAEVRVTGSAAEAFALFTADPPTVLVSDIGMPNEDGYTLIHRVRRLPSAGGGAVPAVALTAYARASDRLRALEAGYQMHAVKPVDPAELIAIVASLAGLPGR